MNPSPLDRLRRIGYAEAISFIVLLGVAMPLKYLAGMPLAVKIVGWAHGVLFVVLCGALAQAAWAYRWPVRRVLLVFAAALVPFGPFLIREQLSEEPRAQS